MKNDLAAPPIGTGYIASHKTRRKSSSYIWGLDLIRFAAAVMVVFFHLSWKLQDPEIGFSAGWVGVEIFFVISGFVIMGSATSANVATFARKRFARLYPAAIICACINLALLIPFADLAMNYGLAVDVTPYSFIASMALVLGPFMVGSLWTLPIEICFYVLIAAAIQREWIGRPARIASALILWSGLYLIPFCLSQYGLLSFRVRSLEYGVLNLSMLRHGCFFGVGILLWMTAQKDFERRGAWRHHAMLWLGIVLCCLEIVARVPELVGRYGHAVELGPLLTSALTTFSMAVLAMWVFGRLNERLRPGPRALSAMRYAGLVTYPLYLLHEGVGGVVSSLLQSNGYGQGFALLTGLALSLIASWIVVIALEPWFEPRLTALAHRSVTSLGSALRMRTSD